MKITGSNVTIMVKDINRSIGFYSSIGFTLQQRWDDNYAMMAAEGITIGLHPGEGIVRSSGSVSIGLFVEEALDCKSLLNKLNVLFDEKRDEGTGIFINFKDPDGTHLYYMQPLYK